MIILTPAQANLVRGISVPGHGIAPRLLKNGMYAVPEAVLQDENHKAVWDILKALPTVPDSSIRNGEPQDPSKGPGGSPIINSDWELDPAKAGLGSPDASWKPGHRISVDLATGKVMDMLTGLELPKPPQP